MVQADRFEQVYVLSEVRTARAVRELLHSQGIKGDRVVTKGYWTSRVVDAA
jgi:hypothetical protein